MCRIGRFSLCFNYGREDLGHRQYGQWAFAEFVVRTIKSVCGIPDLWTSTPPLGATPVSTLFAVQGRGRWRTEPGRRRL
ncbi:MAG: hypothetical protein M3R57_09725 [Chloroflexota bacterium]|nr:hypothetical protein [Chloroflexota bacterium]